MKTDFTNSIQTYLGFDRDAAALIMPYFEVEHLEKGDVFLKSGQFCNRLSYITEGYFRISYDKGAKSVTQWIAGPDSFITELSSLVFNQRSRFRIEALSKATIYSLPKTIYDQMDQYVSDWPKLEKMFLAKCFLTLENRVLSHLSMTAEARYLSFYADNKALFNQVPLQYIASMLGMSPETFSRIRAKHASLQNKET